MHQLEDWRRRGPATVPTGTCNLLVKQRDGISCVQLAKIEYVMYSERTLQFVMFDGRVVRSMTIKESFARIIEDSLYDPRFIRPHESYVVNMDYVAAMTQTHFEMRSGAKISISKRAYRRVRDNFVQYTVGGYADRIL